MSWRIVSPSAKASCWLGVGGEGYAARAALAGVPQHRLGVVGADDDEVEPADPSAMGLELDRPGLAHRPRIERGDLRHVLVGGADEAGCVLGLRDVHRGAVHAVALQPAAVVGEVLAHGPDEDRTLPEVGHAERDVGGDPAAADLEVLGEEGERDLVELLDDEGVAEAALEGHQVVGGDGSGDGYLHSRQPTVSRPESAAVLRWRAEGRGRGAGRRGRGHPAPRVADARTRECYPVVPACSAPGPALRCGDEHPRRVPHAPRGPRQRQSRRNCARTAVRSRLIPAGPALGGGAPDIVVPDDASSLLEGIDAYGSQPTAARSAWRTVR